MNWDNITYIFQIPITWYEKIHKRVFGAYGTNFIRVRDGDDGEMQIDVDEDSFAQAVGQYAIDLSDYYVTLDTDQTITGEKTFTQSINLSSYGTLSAGAQRLNLTHGANGISLSGTSGQLLTNEPDYLYSTGADNQIASRGYCRLNFARANHTHGNIANNGQITADSGLTPTDFYIAADSNGNLYRKNTTGLVPSLSGYVTKDELTDYVQHDELTDYVTQNDLTDYVTQTELTNYVTQNDLADYVTQSDLTDYVTEQDFPNNFFTSLSQAKTTTLNVVTDVTWNGTTLQKKTRQLTISNGLITGVAGELTSTIDTPTVITWA